MYYQHCHKQFPINIDTLNEENILFDSMDLPENESKVNLYFIVDVVAAIYIPIDLTSDI